MNSTYLPALAALAGSAIGGLTSLGSAWLTQHRRARAPQLALHGARRSGIATTPKFGSVDGSVSGSDRVELNQGAAQRNHNRIPRDQRAIDRGIPIHQIAPYRDFGGARGDVFFADLLQLPSPSVERA